jgi:hypothetical protein
MVRELNRLVGSIRHAATDSPPWRKRSPPRRSRWYRHRGGGRTTGDLTGAIAQTQLVRAVADDAGRILAIAEDVASGALQAVERNTLAALARASRTAARAWALDRLAEEVALGTAEAEACASVRSAGTLCRQARTVAKRTDPGAQRFDRGGASRR